MKRYFYAIIIAVIVGLFSCVSFAEDFEMHGKGDSDLPEIEFNLVPPPPVVPEEKIETPEDPQSPPVVEEQEEQLVPPPPTAEEEEVEIVEEEEEVPPPTLTSSTFIVVENNDDPEETPDEPLGRVIPPVKITTVTKTVKTGASIFEQVKTADPNADAVLALALGNLVFEDSGRTVISQKQKSSVNRLFAEEKEVKHNFAKTRKTVLRI